MQRVAVRTSDPAPAEPRAVEPRRLNPVKAWAVVGGAFLLLQFYVYGAWVLYDFERTPNGPTPAPSYMKFSAHFWEVVGVVLTLLVLYRFVIRPWRRDGRLSTDGLICLGFLTIVWQDPLLNYSQIQFTYSTLFYQWGSWANHIPGFVPRQGNLLSEPPFFVVSAYVFWVFGFSMISAAVMRRTRARWPRLGTLGLLAASFVVIFVIEFTLELICMRMGIFAYGGSIEKITFFYGHFYQFPITEGLCCAIVFTLWGSFIYFRDDRGFTIAERGIDRLVGVSARRTTWLRFLALAGALNVLFIVGYNLPEQWVSTHADPWPADIANRSYLDEGVCGPGTAYACGAGRPIPVGAVVGADGRLVVPPGTKTEPHVP